jgi:hypothetical protein
MLSWLSAKFLLSGQSCDALHRVALLQQQLSQIAAILPGGACDQGGCAGSSEQHRYRGELGVKDMG